jgi:hypothetical protein
VSERIVSLAPLTRLPASISMTAASEVIATINRAEIGAGVIPIACGDH